MMNVNKNSIKNPTYGMSYILSGVLLVIVFALCLTVFNLVSFQAAGVALTFTRIIAYISAFVCAAITCVRCAKSNKLNNPDIYTPPRDTVYYFKRMGFITVMIVLMSLAASVVGFPLNAFIGGTLQNNVESLFLSGFLLKLPLFVLYISLVYKMLVRYGFMDSQRKIFNRNLITIAVIISFIIMIPDAVYNSMFYTSPLDMFIPNAQTVLSPNVDIYIMESDGYWYFNESFNIIGVLVTVFLTFAIQAAVFWFSYSRGKKIFIKEHIRKMNEYEMDENI